VFDLSQNHFQLFGLPVSFALDTEMLAERYRILRQTVHPDLFATAGDREKRLALQASTLVNEAYQTLRDPLARASYLLLVRGASLGDDQQTTQDMAFLMEQMELREALAAARQAPEPYVIIERVRARLSSLADELIAALGARLDAGAPGGADAPAVPAESATGTPQMSVAPASDVPAIRELIRKLQFVRKCEVEAEALEAALDEAL
jgi:molecular chaperone HscB